MSDVQCTNAVAHCLLVTGYSHVSVVLDLSCSATKTKDARVKTYPSVRNSWLGRDDWHIRNNTSGMIMQKKTTKYLLANAVYVAAIILGGKYHSEVFAWLASAYTWLMLVGAIGLVLRNEQAIELRVKVFSNPPVSQTFDSLVDIGVAALLIYFGWFWTAAAYIVHVIMVSYARNIFEEERSEK